MTPERPTQVNIDGLDLNSRTPGLHWQFTDIDGWRKGARVDVDQTAREANDGLFSQPGKRRGQVYTITGRLTATDRSQIAHAVDTILAILADGSSGILTVTDRTLGPRWAEVQLLGEPDVAWSGGPYAAYQIGLLNSDPYKYGTISSDTTGFAAIPAGAGFVWDAFPDGDAEWGPLGSQGVATVVNAGTAPSTPTFTITGPTPAGGFTIRDGDGGKALTFLSGVPAGSTLVLDAAAGTALLDGNPDADRSGDLIVEAWPTVPPAATKTFLFEPITGTSAALLTVTCTATYW